MLLGDPFHFLADWPPFAFIRRHCPFYSPVSRMMRGNVLRGFIHSDSTVLFYRCLPNKTFTVFPYRKVNKVSSSPIPDQVRVLLIAQLSRCLITVSIAESNVQLPFKVPARRAHLAERRSAGKRSEQTARPRGRRCTTFSRNGQATGSRSSTAKPKRQTRATVAARRALKEKKNDI